MGMVEVMPRERPAGAAVRLRQVKETITEVMPIVTRLQTPRNPAS
jgi:hypothetical protein